MDFQSLLYRLEKVRGPDQNGQYKTLCPAHDDHDPSLSIKAKKGKILLHCHAGCSHEAVMQSLNLNDNDLFIGGCLHGRGSSKREIEALYDYRDQEGKLVFQVVRYRPKGFGVRKPNGMGGWIKNIQGVHTMLYRLPKLIEAVKSGRVIHVCEGEKDADNLTFLGLDATTAPMGAGKWRDSYSEALIGADVLILPDNDLAGQSHAMKVARSLHGKARSVKILNLPGLPDKGDVSDWITAGGTREQLEQLAAEAPEYQPEPETGRPDDLDVPRHFDLCAMRRLFELRQGPKPISEGAFLVGQTISTFMDDEGKCWPSRAKIAERAGIKNPIKVTRHLRELGGRFCAISSQRGRSNVYTLIKFDKGYGTRKEGDPYQN